jgi:phosphatidylglycerol:prolipoprotein diacylglycerol transferase
MSPVAFNIGDFAVRWYGILITIGIIAGIAIAYFRAKYYGLTKNDLYDLGFLVIITGIIGARITYILANLKYFLANPGEILTLQMSGLAFIGIIIFGIPAIWIFAKLRKLDFWRILDLAAPSVAIGYFFGRLGCFMNGCCYGPESTCCGIIMPGTGIQSPMFPTQLLNALLALIIFVVLYYLATRKTFYRGWLFVMFVYMYSVSSFVTEFLRADPGHTPIWGTPLNAAQWGDILAVILAVIVHLLILCKGKQLSIISDDEVRLIEEKDNPKLKIQPPAPPVEVKHEEEKEANPEEEK